MHKRINMSALGYNVSTHLRVCGLVSQCCLTSLKLPFPWTVTWVNGSCFIQLSWGLSQTESTRHSVSLTTQCSWMLALVTTMLITCVWKSRSSSRWYSTVPSFVPREMMVLTFFFFLNHFKVTGMKKLKRGWKVGFSFSEQSPSKQICVCGSFTLTSYFQMLLKGKHWTHIHG